MIVREHDQHEAADAAAIPADHARAIGDATLEQRLEAVGDRACIAGAGEPRGFRSSNTNATAKRHSDSACIAANSRYAGYACANASSCRRAGRRVRARCRARAARHARLRAGVQRRVGGVRATAGEHEQRCAHGPELPGIAAGYAAASDSRPRRSVGHGHLCIRRPRLRMRDRAADRPRSGRCRRRRARGAVARVSLSHVVPRRFEVSQLAVSHRDDDRARALAPPQARAARADRARRRRRRLLSSSASPSRTSRSARIARGNSCAIDSRRNVRLVPSQTG